MQKPTALVDMEISSSNRIVQNNFSIVRLFPGYDDRDAIPKLLTLVTEENVHTAVAHGIVHDEDEEREV